MLMRFLTAIFVVFVLGLVPKDSYGTTWTSSSVRDPVSGSRVKVAKPMSSGSYIYQWPEKSDQVFWPYTDDEWLWFNPRSGYIGFGDDFEKLDPSKREETKAWLRAHFDRRNPPKSRLERLAWAEQVYTVRVMDEDFWCHFYRLMAFETRADVDTSLEYVKKALPLLVKRLESTQEPGARMETLYLLSEYQRRLGNVPEAASYLEQLSSIEAPGDLSGYKKYLLAIADEQRGNKVID